MRPKTVLLLAFALGCGLVASIGISQYLQNQNTGPKEAKIDGSMLVVAATDIAKGTPIDEKLLKLEKWQGSLPEGAISDPQKVIGRVAQQRLFTGEAVLEQKLAEEGQTRPIPNGLRTVTIRVNLWSSNSGFIKPDDKVDVIMVHKGGSAVLTVAKPILENVTIWAVDQRIETDKNQKSAANPAQAVTLLVTPEQVMTVTLAGQQGDLWLALRSGTDAVTGRLRGVTLEQVLRGEATSGTDTAVTQTEPQNTFSTAVESWLKNPNTKEPQPAVAARTTPKTKVTQQWTLKIMQGRNIQEEKSFELEQREDGQQGWRPAGSTQSTERARLEEPEDAPAEADGPSKPNDPTEIETKSL